MKMKEDHQKIEKARQVFVDENNKMLYSHNVIPLAVWYIRNLDQVDMLEKQMRRKNSLCDKTSIFVE